MLETGVQDPEEGAVILARRLIDEAEVDGCPVNLALVASFRGITQITKVTMAQAGRLIPTTSGLVVHVNADHAEGRRNFTVGHEIGHTLMPGFMQAPRKIDDLWTGSFKDSREEEYLCDVVASEILMPMGLFRPIAERRGWGMAPVTTLASEVRASREATARRLVQAEICPGALAFWRVGLKPAEERLEDQIALPGLETILAPRLRLHYSFANASFPVYLYKHLRASEDGPLAQCADSGNATDGIEKLEIRKRIVELQVSAICVNYLESGHPIREVRSLLRPT